MGWVDPKLIEAWQEIDRLKAEVYRREEEIADLNLEIARHHRQFAAWEEASDRATASMLRFRALAERIVAIRNVGSNPDWTSLTEVQAWARATLRGVPWSSEPTNVRTLHR